MNSDQLQVYSDGLSLMLFLLTFVAMMLTGVVLAVRGKLSIEQGARRRGVRRLIWGGVLILGAVAGFILAS